MKAVITILIAFLLYGCSGIADINQRIYEAQLKAVEQSPYKSAKGKGDFLKSPKKYRLKKLLPLIKGKLKDSSNINDTLWISEYFDATCLDCPSTVMNVMVRDTVYTVSWEIVGHKDGVTYNVDVEPFHGSSKDLRLEPNDLVEVVEKVRNGETLTENPLQYGDDDCNDGGYTIATVIYPDKKIETIYVRCWLPSSLRKIKLLRLTD